MNKQKYNYEGSGRRVRPTTPKLSKTQRIILENMRDGNTEILHYTIGQHIYTRLDDPELSKYNRSSITLPTFNALTKSGFIKRDRTEIFHSRAYHYYRITDTGLAALAALQVRS